MTRSDAQHIDSAKAHLAQLRQHLSRGDVADDILFDAVCMRLSVAIESVGRIDEETRAKEFGRSWAEIWSVRNRIAHGYFYADRSIIESTVDGDLATFEPVARSSRRGREERSASRTGQGCSPASRGRLRRPGSAPGPLIEWRQGL